MIVIQSSMVRKFEWWTHFHKIWIKPKPNSHDVLLCTLHKRQRNRLCFLHLLPNFSISTNSNKYSLKQFPKNHEQKLLSKRLFCVWKTLYVAKYFNLAHGHFQIHELPRINFCKWKLMLQWCKFFKSLSCLTLLGKTLPLSSRSLHYIFCEK
jgi:hypothetical protein